MISLTQHGRDVVARSLLALGLTPASDAPPPSTQEWRLQELQYNRERLVPSDAWERTLEDLEAPH